MSAESPFQKGWTRREFLKGVKDSLKLYAASAMIPSFGLFPFNPPHKVAAAEGESVYMPSDFPIFWPGAYEGRFFTQTRGLEPYPKGYAVLNDEQAPLWDLFRNYGGVSTLGYPISQRWQDEMSRICQAFNRGVIQVTADQQDPIKDEWMSIMDELAQRRIDLDNPTEAIPPSFDWGSDNGKRKEEIQQNHIERVFGEIKNYPQLRTAYFNNPRWLDLYGLPMGIKDYGAVVVLRCQRNALQLWKDQTPWTWSPMEVVPTNGGELAVKYGLVPREAVIPIDPPRTQQIISQKYQAEIVVFRGDPSSPTVYLTIDDFWDPATAEVFLNMADAKGIKITFFPVGNRMAAAPDIFRRIAASGHGIENHTQNHWWLSELSDAGIRSEIRGHGETAKSILNDPGYTQHFLRPPGGAGIFNYDPRIPVIAQQEGLKVAMWTADSNGWRVHNRTDQTAQEYVMQNINAGLGKGAIVLQHGVASDMAVFERLIDDVQARGLTPITLSAGIN